MSEKISITKDAMKAEAKIRRIRGNAQEAQDRVHDKYLKVESEYVGSLSAATRSVLRAAGVLASGNSPVDGIFEGSGEEVELTEVLAAFNGELGETETAALS